MPVVTLTKLSASVSDPANWSHPISGHITGALAYVDGVSLEWTKPAGSTTNGNLSVVVSEPPSLPTAVAIRARIATVPIVGHSSALTFYLRDAETGVFAIAEGVVPESVLTDETIALEIINAPVFGGNWLLSVNSYHDGDGGANLIDFLEIDVTVPTAGNSRRAAFLMGML